MLYWWTSSAEWHSSAGIAWHLFKFIEVPGSAMSAAAAEWHLLRMKVSCPLSSVLHLWWSQHAADTANMPCSVSSMLVVLVAATAVCVMGSPTKRGFDSNRLSKIQEEDLCNKLCTWVLCRSIQISLKPLTQLLPTVGDFLPLAGSMPQRLDEWCQTEIELFDPYENGIWRWSWTV